MRNLFTLLAITFLTSIFSQQNVVDDFEGDGTISTWFGDDCGLNTNFSNPFKTGINTSNTVLKYIDKGGQYANVRFDVPVNFDLSTNHTFSVKIYVPSSSITGSEKNQISLKLQDGKISAPWSTQSEIIKTIVLNQWQTITFDFANDTYINLNETSAKPIDRKDFNRVLIQINDENNNSNVTAYIDDFLYDGTLNDNNNDNSGPDPVFNHLVWSDEFDGNGNLNTENWFKQIIPIINGQSWANGEIQHYTDRIDNSYVSNGTLKILAKKETYSKNGVTKNYTSARLNSKFAFTYGKIEIKAKMPFGAGTFPALWMLGQNITETGGYWAENFGTTGWPDCGEVDIIEHWGENQNFVQSALHNRSSFGGTVNKGGQVIQNASSEFHVYSLEWNANKMIFSVDNIVHYTYNPENKNIENWPYDAPQYLLFNVAILPNIASNFTESAMEIDYVRVYQEATASVFDIDNLTDVRVYPNPVNDKLTIKMPNLEGVSNVNLYNITGKKLYTFNQNSATQTHDFSFLKKGVYLLKIETKSKSKFIKIVKN
ncbi:Por secretion system C-terminal sorting domain-containing protein [Polaribacter sp. KT25b]|uniref:family 16 glycosylhydrolase n=1 Tax=Polaribacter sp. KT25b TaxID=1855336 RepID=UPI00087DF085|nr:family 16 glycosylhydrolase [Polaribacter sp. KT25b]SDS29080.1 Por secretion system C-terminal sorting domain-containing protein [Polaribacter sp. KT25b]